MKKDRYSQNTVREIPLVQIPYDKAAEELRLSRIKKQRKQIDLINKFVVLLFLVGVFVLVLFFCKNGGTAYIDKTRIYYNILDLYKGKTTIAYMHVYKNLDVRFSLMVKHIISNVNKVFDNSGTMLAKRILVNMGCFSVAGKYFVSQTVNGTELKQGVLKINTALKENVTGVIDNIFVCIAKIRHNVYLISNGLHMLVSSASNQISNLVKAKFLGR